MSTEDNNNYRQIGGLLSAERNDRRFVKTPSSEVTNLVMNVMTAGKEHLGELDERRRAVTHNGEIAISRSDTSRIIDLRHKSGDTIAISVSDISSLTGSNKGIMKFFVYALTLANEQALDGNGELTRDHVSFPIKELVELGLYSSVKSARTGIHSALHALKGIQIKASLHKGKKQLEQAVEAVLFVASEIKNSTVTLYLNTLLDWRVITTYYTAIPSFIFSLSNKGFLLAYYIFLQARQNIHKIEQSGSFNISMRAIHSRLMLPSERGNKRPRQTIREPIEKAIDEIEAAANSLDFTLTPHFDEDGNITSYLDNGYLAIGFKGEYARFFIELSKRKAQRIERAIKKKEAIIEKAKIKNMQEKLKADDTATTEELKPATTAN